MKFSRIFIIEYLEYSIINITFVNDLRMKFDILKTRHGKLADKIKKELAKPTPSLDQILEIVHDYENNNLNTIEKLKKEKLYETKRISGALKQTINAHGPITTLLIGSATKRIYGSLLSNGSKEHNPYIKIRKWSFYLGLIMISIVMLFIFLIK